jgi:predicted AAA+ superfamily ATPase
MKRKIERKLSLWQRSKSRNPLILHGLRQCGKTYVLKSWGRQHFPRVHYINFEQDAMICKIFAGNFEPSRILRELSFYLKISIDPGQDLLIFDEIQTCPRALTSLKYFCEDLPTMAIVAAGSLLGLHLGVGSFPVGKVAFLPMYPLSFEEFLLALEEHQLLEIMEQEDLVLPLPQVAHARLWECMTWYMVTGGLPEVVAAFIEEKNHSYATWEKVREKQKQLLLAYYADFTKHSGKENAMHIERVWRAVPSQLAANQEASAKRFQFSHVVPGIDRYQGLVGAIDWLTAAGLILPCAITNQASLPLSAFCKNSLFKLYCADVGLLGALADLPPQSILEQNYGTYKGYFAENFVAQEFTSSSEGTLISWQKERAEIEFVKPWQSAVIPIEVKAGSIIRAKSLQKFISTYKPPFSIVLNGSAGKNGDKDQVHHYPLYLASKIKIFKP